MIGNNGDRGELGAWGEIENRTEITFHGIFEFPCYIRQTSRGEEFPAEGRVGFFVPSIEMD